MGKARFILYLALVLHISASHQVVSAENQKSSPPRGLAVYSRQVSTEEYTRDGGECDLFMQRIPGGKVIRLTDHRAHPELNLGGAIREPKISPDGKEILFMADFRNSSEGARVWIGAAPDPYILLNVWMMTLPTRNIRSITKGYNGWRDVAWSPDGRSFSAVYQTKPSMIVQDTPIPDDIYDYDSQRGRLRKLARMPDAVDDLFWSPDSKKLLFQFWDGDKTTPGLYCVPATGGKATVLIKGKEQRSCYSFSSRRQLAYIQDNYIYIANPDGSESFRAIELKKHYGEHDGVSTYPEPIRPEWSRLGDKLAFAEVTSLRQLFKGSTIHDDWRTVLYVYDTSRHKSRALATIDQEAKGLIWSRDGRWLIVKTHLYANTQKPDPKTHAHAYHRDGLIAVSIADGHIVTLKEPNEETKGIDWIETD